MQACMHVCVYVHTNTFSGKPALAPPAFFQARRETHTANQEVTLPRWLPHTHTSFTKKLAMYPKHVTVKDRIQQKQALAHHPGPTAAQSSGTGKTVGAKIFNNRVWQSKFQWSDN